MEIKIKKLRDTAIMPTKATPGSAAYDLYNPENITLRHGRFIIPLGIALEIPDGYEAKVEPRSGYSSKGFAAYSCYLEKEMRLDADVIVGKIDSDYRGEIGVIVKYNGFAPAMVKRGQRIAQLTFYKTEDVEFNEVQTLSDTKRSDGGFGHSGE